MRGSAWYTKAGIFAAIVVLLMVGSVMLVPPSGIQSSAASSAPTPAPVSAPPANVAPTNAPVTSGPHPGTLDVYEVAPGGATTMDPAAAYDTVSFEPIMNVYQTLIAYTQSSTTNFVPQLATCVPGSNACLAAYGSTLITNNAHTGYPQYFTFVLDKSARFYDPSTGASWPVFPSDVMFSLARTMSFANLPGVAITGGWIQTQALLPGGNSTWDGGIHAPYNNTPTHVLSSMLVNDSAYCPSAAMSQENGCITFNATGGGSDWPFFLELVADPLGAGIVPCGWFTAQDAGLPGFLGSSNAHGDGPCLLPGNATSTSSTSFQTYVHTVNPKAWDAVQLLEKNNPQVPQPNVQWNMVGSGPYYAQVVNKAIGYVLAANPAYQAPSGCAGQPGCEPLPGHYQANVNVYWEQTDSTGIANYQAGQADLATIQLPTHISTFNSLVASGKIGYTYIPTISIFFQPINLNFNNSVTATLPNNPQPTGTNVPGDFFSNVGVRQFLINAYPYATVNSTLLQLPGHISTGFGYGGAIPKYLGNYYNYSIPWPDQNPSGAQYSAAYWWTQLTTVGSPYYDSEVAACTPTSPCVFPIIGETGASFYDSMIPLLIGSIENITHNAIQPFTFDLTFAQLISYGFAAPGSNGLPVWNLGWAPDYPDPTDYVVPMYLPDSTYTFGDSVHEELSLPQFNVSGCQYRDTYNSVDAMAALQYYSSLAAVPNGCQGVAYNVSTYWFEAAAPLSVGAYRTNLYHMANAIDYLLGLYIWNFQELIPATYAPWINPATINANVMIGGGGDVQWYSIGYTSNIATAQFRESGLSAGTSWSVTIGSSTISGTGATLNSTTLLPGTYNYSIGFVSGYTVLPASGSITLTAGSTATANVTYTPFTGGSSLTLAANGLITGTSWSVLLTTLVTAHGSPPAAGSSGPGLVTSTAQAVTIVVPQGNYSYQATSSAGYSLAGGSGAVTVGASGGSVAVSYNPTFGRTYQIVLTASGALPGVTWSASVGGTTQSTTGTVLKFFVQNGTYNFTIQASGWHVTPSTGDFVVAATNTTPQGAVVVSQALVFTFLAYHLTYTAAGLPPGAGAWAVSVNGVSQSTTASTLVFTFTNSTSLFSSFTYVVTAPSGFTVSPSSGIVNFGSGSASVQLTFTATTGTLTISNLPTSTPYNLYINGVEVQTGSTNASYSQSGLSGVVSVEVVASGYNTYFNNVSVAGGSSTPLPVSMVSSSTASASASWTSLSTLAYIIIAVLVVLVIIFIATTFMARGRKPPTQPPETWKSSETPASSEPPK